MTDPITLIDRVALETQDNGTVQNIKTIVEYLGGEDRDDAKVSKSQVVPSPTPEADIIEQSAKHVGSHLTIAGYQTTIAVVGKSDAGTPKIGVLTQDTSDGHTKGTIVTTDVEGLIARLRDIEDEVTPHEDGLELMEEADDE